MTAITNSSAPDNPDNPDNPDKLDALDTPAPTKKPDAAQCGIRPYHIPKNY